MSNQSGPAPGETDLVTLNRAATVARLLAGVAHEINNALQVIGGTTELLQTTPGLPESVTQGLQRITSQNARAAASISDVMLFARQKTDARSRVNLRDVATRSVGLRSFAIGRARLTASIDVALGGTFVVEGNASLLQLAVLNLIVNAEQALAGRQGGVIRVELAEAEGHVLLRVVDNGPGVAPSVVDQIFEPFFTTRARADASGLGLAVARLAAEQHGGTLVLKSHDAGACFEMRLPAKL